MNFNKTLLLMMFDEMSSGDQERVVDEWLDRLPYDHAQELYDQAAEIVSLKEGLIIKAETTDMTSWMLYPDRMGGQFTEEELRDAERWR